MDRVRAERIAHDADEEMAAWRTILDDRARSKAARSRRLSAQLEQDPPPEHARRRR